MSFSHLTTPAPASGKVSDALWTSTSKNVHPSPFLTTPLQQGVGIHNSSTNNQLSFPFSSTATPNVNTSTQLPISIYRGIDSFFAGCAALIDNTVQHDHTSDRDMKPPPSVYQTTIPPHVMNDVALLSAGTTMMMSHQTSTTVSSTHHLTSPRDLTFLQSHVIYYQNHIQHLLARIEEFRYGRSVTSTSLSLNQALLDPASIYLNKKGAFELQREAATVEKEWSTWVLLFHLRQAEEQQKKKQQQQQQHAQQRKQPNQVAPYLDAPPTETERYSQYAIMERIKSENPDLTRAISVLEWLEEVSQYSVSFESDLRGDGSNAARFKRSIRKAQQAPSSRERMRTADHVSNREALDPDVETRLGYAVLDAQDKEEEQRLLSYIWSLIRAGKKEDAIALCRSYDQHWRAATLQGDQLLHVHETSHLSEPAQEHRLTEPVSDQTFQAIQTSTVGNEQRAAWRFSCRTLARTDGLSPVERAIYGLLGCDVKQVLDFCNSWEDVLFALVYTYTEQHMDNCLAQELRLNDQFSMANNSTTIKSMREALSLLSGKTINLSTSFTSASSSSTITLPSSISQLSSSDPYHRLHTLLILGDHEAVENELFQTVTEYFPHYVDYGNMDAFSHSQDNSNRPVTDSYLLFAVHLYLYFHPEINHISSPALTENGRQLILAYINFLAHHQQYSLIVPYLQLLDERTVVELYASLLKHHISVAYLNRFSVSGNSNSHTGNINDAYILEFRKQLLAQCRYYIPQQVLSITKLLVDNILDVDNSRTLTDADSSQPSLMPGSSPLLLTSDQEVLADSSTALVLSSAAQMNVALTPTDLEKIQSLDCFDLSIILTATRQAANQPAITFSHLLQSFCEAISHSCKLYRTFLLHDKLAAAKKLYEHLASTLKWDIFLTHFQQHRELYPAEHKLSPDQQEFELDLYWNSYIREYQGWKDYIKVLFWYEAWNTHHQNKPKPPTDLKKSIPKLNAFELNRYQQKFASELKAWRDTDLTNVDAFYFAAMDICQAQHTIAEQTVGWCQLGHLEQRVIVDNPERNKEFAKLRNKCIHQILSLVHKATFDSECASLCLSLPELIASSRYELYSCFTQEELQEFLKKFRKSYITFKHSSSVQNSVNNSSSSTSSSSSASGNLVHRA